MAGEPRRMAESWKQFGKLRVKELPPLVKKDFTRETLENLVESTYDVLQLQQAVSRQGASSFSTMSCFR